MLSNSLFSDKLGSDTLPYIDADQWPPEFIIPGYSILLSPHRRIMHTLPAYTHRPPVDSSDALAPARMPCAASCPIRSYLRPLNDSYARTRTTEMVCTFISSVHFGNRPVLEYVNLEYQESPRASRDSWRRNVGASGMPTNNQQAIH